MKRGTLFLVILLCFYIGRAQQSVDAIDARMKAIPDSASTSTLSIAAYINQTFGKESEKIRAAYTWVVHNLTYDTDSMYAINWNRGGDLKITESFRRRKGVCENFAGIFIDIVRKAGLTGVTIEGYTKNGNFVNKTGHTWCAVYSDKSWSLYDPTWDKDREREYKYFMLPGSSFAESHMPFDPLWQLTDNPLSHRQFQNLSGGKGLSLPNYEDSINAFMRLSELEQLQATARRIEKSDKITELLKNKIAFLKMQTAIIYEERDRLLFNAAVSDLNKVTDAYNAYILKLNNRVSASELSEDFARHLQPVLALIREAFVKIADIGKYMPNYQYDPEGITSRLHEMSEKILAQQKLLSR